MMENKQNHPPKLKRSMTAGQMEMISLGGAIGVGLFMGSTSTIKWTGPSVLLAYMFVGLILYIVMRATGNIYVMGSVSGIIHAGFDSNVRSIILGDISGAQQLRIGDLVDIVDEEKVTVGTDSLVFVNDLHVLEFTSIDKLKSLRPKIFNQVGGF